MRQAQGASADVAATIPTSCPASVLTVAELWEQPRLHGSFEKGVGRGSTAWHGRGGARCWRGTARPASGWQSCGGLSPAFVPYSARSTVPISWPGARSAIHDNHSAWHACTHRIENAHPCGCREGDRGRYNLVIEITSEPASLL